MVPDFHTKKIFIFPKSETCGILISAWQEGIFIVEVNLACNRESNCHDRRQNVREMRIKLNCKYTGASLR